MAEQSAAAEPTMEEILASIRRIISEEDEDPGAQAEPEAAEAAAPEPEPEAEPEFEPEPEPEPVEEMAAEEEPEEVLELTERVDEGADDEVTFEDPEPEPEPEPAPEPEPEPMVAEAPMMDEEDDLVSEPVANAAASAFGDLVGQMLVSSRSTEGKTLEDIVRELMRPMLREWLDANLKGIVETAVAAEVEKIAGRARR